MEEQNRQKYLQIVTRKLVSLTAGCLLIFVIIFYVVQFGGLDQTYLVLYVFLSGLIGGFVSIQQRLPSIGLNELKELSSSWLSILLIPINGGIFSLILLLMFVSGIIEGSMFPKFSHPPILQEDIVGSFVTWLKTAFPEDGPAIAKLLFWSFVAGFSERFVPQIIRKTTDSIDNNQPNNNDKPG